LLKMIPLLISKWGGVSIFVFIIVPLIFIANFWGDDERDEITRCTANVLINRAGLDLSANVKIELSMSHKNGVFYIDGNIYRKGVYHGAISRRVLFDVNIVNGDILLISKRNWKTEVDDIDIASLSGSLFSDFYIAPDNTMVLFLTKNEKGYYLSTKTMPMTYCAKITG
jgi:hypothetical protein